MTEILRFTAPIPDSHKRDWVIYINGQEVVDVSSVIAQSKWGRVEYGFRNNSFDGIQFESPGGGGATTLPFSFDPKGNLIVGMIEEYRPNMGGTGWCALGGYKDKNESPEETQRREALEESGLDTRESFKLPGPPMNGERDVMVTDHRKNRGVHMFAKFVPFHLLKPSDEQGDYKLKDGIAESKKEANLQFFIWLDAIDIAVDEHVTSSIAKLFAYLVRQFIVHNPKKISYTSYPPNMKISPL